MLQYNELYIKHITGERGSMLNFIRGFCMALADSVPGVSGGTVAFLLGFYDKFIMSLDHLMSGTKEERIEAIKFLIRASLGESLSNSSKEALARAYSPILSKFLPYSTYASNVGTPPAMASPR